MISFDAKSLRLINELNCRLLQLSLDNRIVKPNILPRVIFALMQNRAARFTVWHFCRQNFAKLEQS